jgi:steroid 5-alpha reductase family enzyme
MTLAALIWEAFIAEAGLAAFVAGAWAIQRRTGTSGWIDASWTFGVGAMGVLLALAPNPEPSAPPWRRAMVAALAVAWSLRLGLHIVARTLKGGDDPRYRKLIEEWAAATPARLFQFLQAQALVGAVLARAVALAAKTPSAQPRVQDVAGVALFAATLIGKAVADSQVARFKADPASRGAICDFGLWSRSRHPNYFFEWLAWVAYPLIAIDFTGAYDLGWAAVLAPALMYWTLRYVSGVPPLEEHMQRTRGPAFTAYQLCTPVFFPRLGRTRRCSVRVP